MDITGTSLAALNTVFITAFNMSLTGVETTHGRVSMTVNSTTRTQSYPKLSEIPGMREWLGDRVINRFSVDGFQITNRKFENTIAVSVDDIADDQVSMFSTTVSEFGQTAAELPDDLVWEQVAAGFATTHYDGQFFFDTDHPVEDENGVEQSVSNLTAGASPAWYLIDTSRVIKPFIFQDREAATITAKTNLSDDNVLFQDEFIWAAKRRCAAGFGAWQMIHASKAALTPANYAAARQAMLEMRGHRGRKLNIRPNLLVVSPGNEGAAREILLNERDNSGATNTWRNSAELHVETRLS